MYPKRAKKITHLIAKMIARDILHLNLSPSNFKVMQILQPDYRIPSWKTFRVELHNEYMISNLKTTLGTTDSVAITSDSWTAFPTESYHINNMSFYF